MRLRASQFACFLVLLSAFGAADAVSRKSECRNCAGLHALLQQIAATSAAQPVARSFAAAEESATLLPAERTQSALSWTMPPPAAQALAQHASTGSGL